LSGSKCGTRCLVVLGHFWRAKYGHFSRAPKSWRAAIRLSINNPLRRSIDIRTFERFVATIFEMDMVAHCGKSVAGSHVRCLVLTDIAFGWPEAGAIAPKRLTPTSRHRRKIERERYFTMPTPEWREPLIQAAAKWPRGFRALLSNGNWQLVGAPASVANEFREWAGRIRQEFHFPRSSMDAADVLLYRLKASGAYVRSRTVLRKRGKRASAEERSTIYPLRNALIKYISSGYAAPPSADPSSSVEIVETGQAAAANRNRVRATRMSIIAALLRLGVPVDDWPKPVRDFYEQADATLRQVLTPPPYRPPHFDRLVQSSKEWAKLADKGWQHHRDEFLRRSQLWIDARVDESIPPANRTRMSASSGFSRKRGANTPLEQRYRWAAQYFCGVPIKEIAAQSEANPDTVGRIARAILGQAAWPASRRPRRGNN
jgi:hypothetical protein